MLIKISVVIPTYRRAHLLQKCISALVEQSFDRGSYEVLVVSDGYDETTEEAVRQFQHHPIAIHYLYLPQKKGPAAARNLGWQQAKGVLVAFTDDDTIPDKNWLSGFWKAYHNEALVAYTGKVKVPTANPPTDYEKNVSGLETADFVTANCCCTRQALEKVGGFDERFSMAWREDSDLEFKLMLHQIPIRYKVDALVVHPVREAPWGVSIKEQKKSMFNALLYKKYPGLYRHKIQRGPRWDYYIIVAAFLLMLVGIVLQMKWLPYLFFLCWLFFTTRFIIERLSTTTRRFGHVLEMIITSVVIPFVAVYWRLYGSWKYRVFFL